MKKTMGDMRDDVVNNIVKNKGVKADNKFFGVKNDTTPPTGGPLRREKKQRMMLMKKSLKAKHPGFKKVQSKIAAKGYGKKAAGAILANATRKASGAAKKKNPRLKKVK